MGTIPHWIRQGRPPVPRAPQEMQAADPAARKRALLFVALAALLAATLLAIAAPLLVVTAYRLVAAPAGP